MKLTQDLQRTLQAAVDRIVPPDEYPGALESGVLDYLLRQFEKDLRPFVEDYCLGLTSLESESLVRFDRSFCSLADHEKDEILSRIEAGEVATNWSVAPQKFFRLLNHTTVEGFYSDPEQGGNRDRLSWTMIGFESN